MGTGRSALVAPQDSSSLGAGGALAVSQPRVCLQGLRAALSDSRGLLVSLEQCWGQWGSSGAVLRVAPSVEGLRGWTWPL